MMANTDGSRGRKSFGVADPNELFLRMFPQGGAEKEEEETPPPEVTPHEPAPASQAAPAKQGTKAAPVPSKSSAPQPKAPVAMPDEKKLPRASRRIYMSDRLDKALRRRLYMDPTMNLSEHVCAALEIYLKADLDAVDHERP